MRSAILRIRVMFLVLDNIRIRVYYASLQRLPLTRALKGFFLRFKPTFWWTSINRYHDFSRVGLEKILSPFLEHLEEYVGVSAVYATFCCRI